MMEFVFAKHVFNSRQFRWNREVPAGIANETFATRLNVRNESGGEAVLSPLPGSSRLNIVFLSQLSQMMDVRIHSRNGVLNGNN